MFWLIVAIAATIATINGFTLTIMVFGNGWNGARWVPHFRTTLGQR